MCVCVCVCVCIYIYIYIYIYIFQGQEFCLKCQYLVATPCMEIVLEKTGCECLEQIQSNPE